MISLLLNICLFRAKPQDLPASNSLLKHCIAAGTAAFMIRNIMITSWEDALIQALVQSTMLGASLYLFLLVFKKPERWLQSASALYGCSALMVVIMLPVLKFFDPETALGPNPDFTTLLVITVSLWSFIVTAFILKETLDIGKFASFWMTVLLEVMIVIVIPLTGSSMGNFAS